MGKVYIIRKKVFFHNDLDNIPVGMGDVVGVFDEYEQAYQAYLSCEKHQHQQWHISSFEIAPSKGKASLEKIQYFFQKHFPQYKSSIFKDITQVPPLPAEATLAQTEEFVKLSGLQLYDLSVHEQMPQYFRIKMADEFWGEEDTLPFTVFFHETSALYFLQGSEEEATKEALNVAYSYLWQDMLEETNSNFAGLQGKLRDLSKTPDVLASYLQNCKDIGYDMEQKKIRLSPEAEDGENILKELEGLFALLVLPAFHIMQLDLESMRNKPVKIAEMLY